MKKILKIFAIALFTLFVGYNMLSAKEIKKEFHINESLKAVLTYDTDLKGKCLSESDFDEWLSESEIAFFGYNVEDRYYDFEERYFDSDDYLSQAVVAAHLYAESTLVIYNNGVRVQYLEYTNIYSPEDNETYIGLIWVY